MEDDIFAELDLVIAAATSKEKLLSDRKKQQTIAKSRWTPSTERKQALEELAIIDKTLQALLWTPLATVAFFAEQHCDNCGSDHSLFLQYMQKESAGKVSPATRWTRVSKPDLSLPKEVIIQQTTTHICKDCCDDFGFSLPTAEVKFLSSEAPFTVSPNYLQEEINATE